MCKTLCEGGQRCATETRKKYHATSPDDPAWDAAAVEYASTPEGHQALTAEMQEAGARREYVRVAQLGNALHRGAAMREANKEAAIEIKVAQMRIDRNEVNAAIEEAKADNPDGWAVDPEAVLGSLEEPTYDVDRLQGREAAIEYLRSEWHRHRDGFCRAVITNAPAHMRWTHAAMLVEVERLAARYNRS